MTRKMLSEMIVVFQQIDVEDNQGENNDNTSIRIFGVTKVIFSL
jgi:hypothetical protein